MCCVKCWKSRAAAITVGPLANRRSVLRTIRVWSWLSRRYTRAREALRAGALAEGLQDHGYQVGVGRIKRLRRKLNIRCVQKYKFKATTNSNHDLLVAPNRLEQNFVATRLAVWVTDITCIATAEGWLYLAGIRDLYTCELVGYRWVSA